MSHLFNNLQSHDPWTPHLFPARPEVFWRTDVQKYMATARKEKRRVTLAPPRRMARVRRDAENRHREGDVDDLFVCPISLLVSNKEGTKCQNISYDSPSLHCVVAVRNPPKKRGTQCTAYQKNSDISKGNSDERSRADKHIMPVEPPALVPFFLPIRLHAATPLPLKPNPPVIIMKQESCSALITSSSSTSPPAVAAAEEEEEEGASTPSPVAPCSPRRSSTCTQKAWGTMLPRASEAATVLKNVASAR